MTNGAEAPFQTADEPPVFPGVRAFWSHVRRSEALGSGRGRRGSLGWILGTDCVECLSGRHTARISGPKGLLSGGPVQVGEGNTGLMACGDVARVTALWFGLLSSTQRRLAPRLKYRTPCRRPRSRPARPVKSFAAPPHRHRPPVRRRRHEERDSRIATCYGNGHFTFGHRKWGIDSPHGAWQSHTPNHSHPFWIFL